MPKIVRAGGGDACFVDRELFPEVSEHNSNAPLRLEYIFRRNVQLGLVYNKKKLSSTQTSRRITAQ